VLAPRAGRAVPSVDLGELDDLRGGTPRVVDDLGDVDGPHRVLELAELAPELDDPGDVHKAGARSSWGRLGRALSSSA
jgi:hypothetical protein